MCRHKKPKRVYVREPLASEDGGGSEIHLGEGVSIQSFSLTHSFSVESFWIQMEGLYYTILLPQFPPNFERWYYPPHPPPCDYAFLCTVFISSCMVHAGICPRSIKNNCKKKNHNTVHHDIISDVVS